MALRIWSSLVVVAVVTVVGCTSPGKQFSYKDVKVGSGPTASPSQPVVGQETTLSFSVRNTWNKQLDGVAWELWETGDTPVMLTSGSDTIRAFGSAPKTFVIPAIAKGTHTYEVRVDPGEAIAEQDETNNTSKVLTVIAADQDIAFDREVDAVITWADGPDAADEATLTFTVTNTVDEDQETPTSPITVPFTIKRNGEDIAFTFSPDPLTVASDGSTAVTVTLPATASAGRFEYTITLAPADGDDSNVSNNVETVTVVIPASG